MSVEIQEARRKLKIIEQASGTPEIILTDLFREDVNDVNFLYQVDVCGKNVFDYLKEQLKKMKVFNGCILKCKGSELHIYVPSLRYGENKKFLDDDKIVVVDMAKKTYMICSRAIEEYNEIMNCNYTFTASEMPQHLLKYENFDFKNRIKISFGFFRSEKKFF